MDVISNTQFRINAVLNLFDFGLPSEAFPGDGNAVWKRTLCKIFQRYWVKEWLVIIYILNSIFHPSITILPTGGYNYRHATLRQERCVTQQLKKKKGKKTLRGETRLLSRANAISSNEEDVWRRPDLNMRITAVHYEWNINKAVSKVRTRHGKCFHTTSWKTLLQKKKKKSRKFLCENQYFPKQ